MRTKVLVIPAMILLAVLGLGAYVLLFTSSPRSSARAAEVLNRAASAEIAPPAGKVLQLTLETTQRMPSGATETRTADIWLLMGDDAGTVAKRYLVQRDASGTVVQEELFDGTTEYVYLAARNAVLELTPQRTMNANDIALSVDQILDSHADAEYVGEEQVAGRLAQIVRVKRDLGDGLPGEATGLIADLENVESIETEFAIDAADAVPIGQVMKAVTEDGSTHTLISKTYIQRKVVDPADLPADLFELHHAPEEAFLVR
jgi:hypothetical protein